MGDCGTTSSTVAIPPNDALILATLAPNTGATCQSQNSGGIFFLQAPGGYPNFYDPTYTGQTPSNYPDPYTQASVFVDYSANSTTGSWMYVNGFSAAGNNFFVTASSSLAASTPIWISIVNDTVTMGPGTSPFAGTAANTSSIFPSGPVSFTSTISLSNVSGLYVENNLPFTIAVSSVSSYCQASAMAATQATQLQQASAVVLSRRSSLRGDATVAFSRSAACSFSFAFYSRTNTSSPVGYVAVAGNTILSWPAGGENSPSSAALSSTIGPLVYASINATARSISFGNYNPATGSRSTGTPLGAATNVAWLSNVAYIMPVSGVGTAWSPSPLSAAQSWIWWVVVGIAAFLVVVLIAFLVSDHQRAERYQSEIEHYNSLSLNNKGPLAAT